jgi:hypothetical protein
MQQNENLNLNTLSEAFYRGFSRVLSEEGIDLAGDKSGKKIERIGQELKDYVRQLSTQQKISSAEISKIKATISKAKQSKNVDAEIKTFFKSLERAYWNKEKERTKYINKESLSQSIPDYDSISKKREDRYKKVSFKKFETLNNRLIKITDDVASNTSMLGSSAGSLRASSKKLGFITSSIVSDALKLDKGISWVDSATSSIRQTREKVSRLTNILIGSSIKLNKDASWVEEGVQSIKGSSRRLRGVFKGGMTGGRSGANDESRQEGEENKFISNFVKALEKAGIGGGNFRRDLGIAIALATGSVLKPILGPIGSMVIGAGMLFNPAKTASVIGKGIVGSQLGQKAITGAMDFFTGSKVGGKILESGIGQKQLHLY